MFVWSKYIYLIYILHLQPVIAIQSELLGERVMEPQDNVHVKMVSLAWPVTDVLQATSKASLQSLHV